MVGPPTSLNIWHLHFFKRVDGPDCPYCFIDSYDGNENLKPGEWRRERQGDGCLQNMNNVRGSRPTKSAKAMREAVKLYLNIDNRAV